MTQIAKQLGVAAQPGNHMVQFYDGEPSALAQNVAAFIDIGLQRGDSVLVVASPDHSDAFLSALDKRLASGEKRSRRIAFLEAQATLDQIMDDGQPDWRRFERVIGGMIRGMRRATPDAGLCVYGEMVGILWAAGQAGAAVQIEKFWNVLLSDVNSMLFCAYPIDVFAEGFQVPHLHDILCTHTHVLPNGTESQMAEALDRAMLEMLGKRTEDNHLGAGINHASWPPLLDLQATILRLRKHHSDYASEILSRARSYYRSSTNCA